MPTEPGLRPHIPNRHHTARSAGGSENVIRSAATTIIYPSLRALTSCSASNLEYGKPRRSQPSRDTRFLFSIVPITVLAKGMSAFVNKPACKSPGANQVDRYMKCYSLPTNTACHFCRSLHRETYFSTWKAIRSLD